MVQQTSLEAYEKLRTSGVSTTQRVRILNYIRGVAPVTRQQICRDLRININAVCGRVNELICDGFVYVIGTKECPVTGRIAEMIVPMKKDKNSICMDEKMIIVATTTPRENVVKVNV